MARRKRATASSMPASRYGEWSASSDGRSRRCAASGSVNPRPASTRAVTGRRFNADVSAATLLASGVGRIQRAAGISRESVPREVATHAALVLFVVEIGATAAENLQIAL